MTTRVFLLDDHEVVRRGLRELFESEEDLTVVGEGGHRPRGARPGCRRAGPTWPCSTSGFPTVTVSRCVGTCARPCPSSSA